MAKKILIVDDEPDVRSVLQIRLRYNQYDTITASNGKEALEKVKYEKPDLIILDVLMPGLSGYEFIEALKKIRPETGPIPVIVISAKHSMKDFFNKWDIQCFIPKPIDADLLLAKIQEGLRAKTPSGESSAGKVSEKPSEQKPGDQKHAVVIGVEEYIRDKVKKHLESIGFTVDIALHEKEVLEIALRLRSDLVLSQYWEDTAVLDAMKIPEMLAEKAETRNIPFAVFCMPSLGLDAIKTLPESQVLTFEETSQLFVKIDRFIAAVKK